MDKDLAFQIREFINRNQARQPMQNHTSENRANLQHMPMEERRNGVLNDQFFTNPETGERETYAERLNNQQQGGTNTISTN